MDQKIFRTAIFSKLNREDKVIDVVAIEELDKKWGNNFIKDNFVTDFMDTSNSNIDFFCMELEGNEKLSDRIVGLASVWKHGSKHDLLCIVTKENFQAKKDCYRTLKEIGRNVFAGVINEANKAKVSCLEFCSICERFYRKITKDAGISLHGTSENYSVRSDDFGKYLDYCRKNFGANFSLDLNKTKISS